MSGPPGIEEACDEIVALRREIDRQKVRNLVLETKLEDAQTLEHFWRRAAEQALRLWDRSQNEYDNLIEELDSSAFWEVRRIIARERAA